MMPRFAGCPRALRGPITGMTLIALTTAAAVVPGASQAKLIGVTYEGDVWQIDDATGEAYRIGPTGYVRENALALDGSGILFSQAELSDTDFEKRLEAIDPDTGIGVLGPELPPSISLRSMAFSPGGVLYAVATPFGVSQLLRIDAGTGGVTAVGPTADGVQALDFGPDGLLYGYARGVLGTLDLDTGAFTGLTAIQQGIDVQSFVFLPDGRLLGGRESLYEIDVLTGATELFADLGEDFRGFEYLPGPAVPEPGTALLLAMGLARLAIRRVSPSA